MDEAKVDILETKEVGAFSTVEWIKKKIDKVKKGIRERLQFI